MSHNVCAGRYYILNGHDAVPCEDHLVWAQWIENNQKSLSVAYTEFPGCFTKPYTVDGPRFGTRQTAYVSTVFLGLDHNWDNIIHGGDGPPVLFETMVFWDGPLGGEGKRYATWEEADRGHEDLVWKVRLALGPNDPFGVTH
jgi:hypothetical protein